MKMIKRDTNAQTCDINHQNMTFDTNIIRSNEYMVIIILTDGTNDGPNGEVDIIKCGWIMIIL